MYTTTSNTSTPPWPQSGGSLSLLWISREHLVASPCFRPYSVTRTNQAWFVPYVWVIETGLSGQWSVNPALYCTQWHKNSRKNKRRTSSNGRGKQTADLVRLANGQLTEYALYGLNNRWGTDTACYKVRDTTRSESQDCPVPVPAEAKEARRGRRGTRHCLLTVPSGPQQSHFSGFKIALWSEACDHAWVDSQEFVGIHTVYVRLFVVRFLKTHSFFSQIFCFRFFL